MAFPARHVIRALLVVAASGCAPAAPRVEPAPEAPRVQATALSAPAESPARRPRDRFAVASENATGVEVARDVLERGGNAVDATVSGLLVACAAHASSCGLGGGGVALVQPVGSDAYVVDFREVAPHGIRRADHLSKTPPPNRRGVMIGVPGLVAGLAKMHERGGKLPWKDLVSRAADVVDAGIPLSPYMAQALSWSAKWVRDDDGARRVFVTDAESRVGETMKNPALARALRVVAEKGRAGFYTGEIADDIVMTSRAAGSRVTPADLSSYEAVVRAPLRFEWDGHVVLTAPPPSGGGVTLAELLGFLTPDDQKSLEWGSGALVHVLAEGARGAYADRARLVGDPAFTKMDLPAMLDPARLRERRAAVKMDETALPKLPSIADGGTLHFVAIDDEGGIVSITATLTGMFGAKVMTKSGFVLNDALTDFTTDDYGLRAATKGPNFPRGGARPVSSLTPTLVLRGGRPELALGGSGGLRAPAAIAQVMLLSLSRGKALTEAVSAPRFHVGPNGALTLDAGLAGARDDLVARGEIVAVSEASFSSVTAVAIREEAGVRVLEPVFDPRKGGAVTVGRGETVTEGAHGP